MLARISAAKVSQISSGMVVHSFITWRGGAQASTVTADTPAGTPRSSARGIQGLPSSSSARQNDTLPGWPSVEWSSVPGAQPNRLISASRSARPMTALARAPPPRALSVALRPMARRTGPLTMTSGALPPVLAALPCSRYAGSHMASTAAATTGRSSGRQPAITAFTATFSAVMTRPRTGSTPRIDSGSSSASSRLRRTSSGVGGTIGSPSVQPLRPKSSLASKASATSRGRDPSPHGPQRSASASSW